MANSNDDVLNLVHDIVDVIGRLIDFLGKR